MSKKNRHPKRGQHGGQPGGRTTPPGTRPQNYRPKQRYTDDEPPFTADAAARLRESSPFGLLAMASGLIEVTTPRPLDRWGPERPERPDPTVTFTSFADSGYPAMSALALAAAALHPDKLLAARVRRAVGEHASGHAMPAWLAWMDQITITETSVLSHILGDGDNVNITWRWPDGQSAMAVVYIDHNLGTIVKDAFAYPDADELQQMYGEMQDPNASLTPIDAAEARARVQEAIDHFERVIPPIETETWPSCRPMIEWLVRHLPEGGTGYVRPEWSEEQRQQLLDEFVASPHGAADGLTDEQVRELADPLVWFGCDYGPGDPLRWSQVSVEIVLDDWYPRKVFGLPADEMRRLPDVLTGFVRFAHERRGIPRLLTDDTVAVVAELSGDYRRALAQPGRSPGSNASRMARLVAGLDPDAFDDYDDEFDDDGFDDGFDDDDGEFGDDELDHEADMTEIVDALEAHVVELVGGRAALEALDDTPLPDVEFDWSRVPAGLEEPTAATLEHLDRWSTELFDAEVRTIARVVLAAVVDADRSVFKRSSRADSLAAAILWFLHQRLSGRLATRERQELGWKANTQKAMAAATGVSATAISSRTKTLANVVDGADIDWTNLLHSTQREDAIRSRELITGWRLGHPT